MRFAAVARGGVVLGLVLLAVLELTLVERSLASKVGLTAWLKILVPGLAGLLVFIPSWLHVDAACHCLTRWRVGSGLLAVGIALYACVGCPVAEHSLHAKRHSFAARNRLPAVILPAVFTDRNAPVLIYASVHGADDIPDSALERCFLKYAGLVGRMIETGVSNSACNCHGYVFTGGRYGMDGELVDMILNENGYHKVRTPSTGDLIVYRTASGEIAHTGLVRAYTEDGSALIESKFGPMGSYLHGHDIACYEQRFDFYRSSREGHLLAGLDRTP